MEETLSQAKEEVSEAAARAAVALVERDQADKRASEQEAYRLQLAAKVRQFCWFDELFS